MATILSTTKDLLGIPAEVEDFDSQLTVNINGAIAIVNELGVITYIKIIDADSELEDLISDEDLHELLQMYIYMKVRLNFDPPSVASVLQSLENTIKEYEWRLNNYVQTSC